MDDGFATQVERGVHNDGHAGAFLELVKQLPVQRIDFSLDGLRARAAGTIASPGYLAALRNGRLHVTRLDYIYLPLRISAMRLYGEGANTVYEFILSAATVLVAEGRVTIVERA